VTTQVTVGIADWDDPDVTALHALQRADIDGRYGGDTEPGTKPSKADISVVMLARDTHGVAVGTGALRRLDDTSAEIKRMYTVDSVRGAGVGRALLGALEQYALDQGWTVLRLETGPLQHEAIGLYTSAGYEPIAPFGPYVGAPQSLCFERKLER
jgi:GNAT superfamily N-acetyltransferase